MTGPPCVGGTNGNLTIRSDASSFVWQQVWSFALAIRGFDPATLESLIAEANEIARANSSPIDSIRIVPEP